jgi:hypothetical protein
MYNSHLFNDIFLNERLPTAMWFKKLNRWRRFGASPHAPAACGTFAEGAWDKLMKTEETFEMTFLTPQKKNEYYYTFW